MGDLKFTVFLYFELLGGKEKEQEVEKAPEPTGYGNLMRERERERGKRVEEDGIPIGLAYFSLFVSFSLLFRIFVSFLFILHFLVSKL